MKIGETTFGFGALIALITGLVVFFCLLFDEWTVKRAAYAIIALAIARIVP